MKRELGTTNPAEKTNGNSYKVQAVPSNIEFLNGKERKEWVNFLKFGGIGGTLGRLVDWNMGIIISI